MKYIIHEIESLDSNHPSIFALKSAVENDEENFFPVHHERCDDDETDFFQYSYYDTGEKVEHDKLVGFEVKINGEWKLALFKDLYISG